jgi:3-oxoadipate enol-lactonase
MARVKINGFEIDYQVAGSGRPIALAHSLGMAGSIFDPLRSLLEDRARVVTWDARGNGNSQKPATGWTIEDLASDLDGLLEHLGIDRAVIGGLSMGGCTAVAYAVAHPEKLDGLILMDTTAGYGEEKRDAWEQRAKNAETKGMEPVIPFNRPRWFSSGFLESNPQRVEAVGKILLANDTSSYAAACRALGRFDARSELHKIQCPTLIIVGEGDPATPLPMAEHLHENIKNSELHVLEGLKHMSPVEAPERVGQLIQKFLERI